MPTAHDRNETAVVVFDLDGTLVDTSGDIIYSANHVRAEAGLLPLERDEILRHVGWGAQHLIARILGLKRGAPVDDHLTLFREHYRAHQTERSALYPGILDAVDALRARCDLYVLSNKPHPAVVEELRRREMLDRFRVVWGLGALERPKPDPLGIELALATSGARKERCVMVGDMRPDVLAGQAALVHTVLVGWGFGLPDDEPVTPSAAIDRVDELVPTVLGLISS